MKKTAIALTAAAVLLAACGTDKPIPADNGQTVKPVKQSSKRPTFDTAAESVASSGFNANTNVQQWIDYEVAQKQFSRSELQQFFDGAAYKGNIINIMYRPGTSRPWYEFRQGNSGTAKFNNGRKFYAENRAVIDDVAKQYGVPAGLIVAIIGIETNYGRNTGTFRVADALSTLAFDYPRRAEFFQNELAELLLIAREEKRDVFSFKGSYAGAMGIPQFMPSSFRKWAVDYDGDGKRDIWNNIGDVAASVANYMKQHGWQTGGKMVVPVTLNINGDLQAIIDEKTALTRTVADFKKMGVVPQQPVADSEKAVLYRLETAPGVYEYYLGLNNFYAVWKYNNSRMYATAVRDIANAVDSSGL
ncbi:lytic murein transglycosylase B [Neisseria animalis]|uniref:Lytic murein transglycosylase B n=1 Tax=Neisseria animalis TaxID=492 RepID=A0A5P3MQC1_NEIAN|nr:lytic murein transglycosylase B [Neisseria animalis]QEY23265.1 lytic murein transglycosylase B [Neisseria animalis]ROW31980.1 lytic murein transglycosylase B [Neisseria animalis]VEE08543.1 membrane-bound lytic murein transglycosylase B [Neisseria animalis]